MIDRNQVMPLLVAACPSFREAWDAYLAKLGDDERLLYIELGELAHHLVDLMRRGAVDELPAVFDAVERVHLEGDAYVKEAATIGLLEGIQNHAEHAGVSPERFVPYLQPESAIWWAELNEFWAGRSPYVGAGRKTET